MTKVLIVTVPCHFLSSTLHTFILVLSLFWSILREFKEEDNVAEYTESLPCRPILIIQEVFRVYWNKFETAVKHLFLIISHYFLY